MSKSKSTASDASTDDKTATIQYKPVTSLVGNNNALAHYEQSRGFDQISQVMHYPVFMACVGAAVIFLTSYPYTV